MHRSASLLVALVLASCASPPVEVVLGGIDATTCSIRGDASLWCWGRSPGDWMQTTPRPARIGTARWRAVGPGTLHSCGIQEDGSLWCWGRNCAGQLGDGTRLDRPEPGRVGTASDHVSVATGGGHTCALHADGALTCIGGPDYGQDDCSTTPYAEQVFPGRWRAVSGHYYAVLAIREDGTLWRMRDGTPETATFLPLEQIGTATWRSISTGVLSACGVRDDGTLACASHDEPTEIQVGTDTDWSGAIATHWQTCAIRLDGTLWCWGRNDSGQVGNGAVDGEDVPEPVRIGDASDWRAVTAGFTQSCGLRAGGRVLCWGWNDGGELGVGLEVTSSPTPIELTFE